MILVTMVLTSRLLGLVRDRLLASRFAPEELGVYFAAFRLPNFIFELLVTGALTSAFIPVFTKYLTQDKEKEGWHMASTVINISVLLYAFISIPILIWAKEFSKFLFIAKGSSGEVRSMLYLALELEYIPKEEFEEMFQSAGVISKMLASLIKTL